MVHLPSKKTNQATTVMDVQPNDAHIKRLTDELPAKISSYKESVTHVKKILITALSNILYHRNIFDESSYTFRLFDNYLVRLVNPKSNEKGVKMLTDWMEGVFDAIDKNYLKTMYLTLFENEEKPEHVFETYEFTVKYSNNRAGVILSTNESTSILTEANFSARNMLKTLEYLMGLFEQLPTALYMNMRIFYYDDVTPIEYEPPGFKSSDFESFKFDNGERCFFECGDIDQRWLQMKVNVNITGSMFKKQADVTAINDTFTEDTTTSFAYERPKKRMKLKNQPDDSEKPLSNVPKPSSPKRSISKDENHSDVSEMADTDFEEKETSDEESIFSPSLLVRHIKCDCQLQDENNVVLIQCKACKDWQHAICNNLLIEKDDAPKYEHVCKPCDLASTGNKSKESEAKIFETCIRRRVLIWLRTQTNEMTFTEWKQQVQEKFPVIKNPLATKLLKALESDMILTIVDKKKGKRYQIDMEVLEKVISNFFKRVQKKPSCQELDKNNNEMKASKKALSEDSSDKENSPRRPVERNQSAKKRKRSSEARENLSILMR